MDTGLCELLLKAANEETEDKEGEKKASIQTLRYKSKYSQNNSPLVFSEIYAASVSSLDTWQNVSIPQEVLDRP